MHPRPVRPLTPQHMLGHSETERCAQIYPAAGQPSPAKTLLHRGPTQGTCSQGLMANRLIARYFSLGINSCTSTWRQPTIAAVHGCQVPDCPAICQASTLFLCLTHVLDNACTTHTAANVTERRRRTLRWINSTPPHRSCISLLTQCVFLHTKPPLFLYGYITRQT